MLTCPLLLLSTLHKQFASRSGYQLLTDYLPGAEFVYAQRGNPTSSLPRLGAWFARQLAFTSWYTAGSAVMEWKAIKSLCSKDSSIVHFLWADLDMGFLDLLVQRQHRLCGTFHNCSDTIGEVIRFPSRLRQLDAAILMSESQRTFFIEAGVPDDRMHVVLHGVDTLHFTPPIERPTDKLTVLSVGSYRRNFSLLKRVCAALRDDQRIQFEIVGSVAMQALFDDEPNVRFYQGINDAELLSKYQQASCFLLTTENATANNALLEGMACGLPVVAERIGGIPEYTTDASAFLVDQGDTQGLCDAIRTLADSHQACQEMGLAARQRAEALDWHRVAKQMFHIYTGLL